MKKKSRINIYLVLLIAGVLTSIILLILEWTLNIFKDVRFLTTEVIKVILALFQTLLIAWFISGELKKNSKITRQALDLESQGITGVNRNGILTYSENSNLFSNAYLIKIMVVCGKNFILKNENKIINALKRGCEIRLLISKEYSDFVQEITNQLDALDSKEAERENRQSEEIKFVLNKIQELSTYGKISVRQYNTEYRVPFYLGYFKEEEKVIKGWYNSIIPVCSPRNTIMFKGEFRDEDRENYVEILSDSIKNKNGELEKENYTTRRNNKVRNTIVDLECHFDYLWNTYDDINLKENSL